VRCTSCNEPTRVIDSRPRDDGVIRRRRECTARSRRFTTEEWPNDIAGFKWLLSSFVSVPPALTAP
jgi:transcriptional regulator NrdR family protein